MDNPTPTVPGWGQVVAVPRGERWSSNRRLQELHISCSCPIDGTLRVDVNDALELMLVCSVIRQFTSPRQSSIGWLERCWQTQVSCTTNH